jgi:hypothetical protein
MGEGAQGGKAGEGGQGKDEAQHRRRLREKDARVEQGALHQSKRTRQKQNERNRWNHPISMMYYLLND